MKNKQILALVIVLVILYFIFKNYITQTGSSILGVPNSSSTTTTTSNPISNFLSSLFKKPVTTGGAGTSTLPANPKVTTGPTLLQAGAGVVGPTLAQAGKTQFDYSYCGVSQDVLNAGVPIQYCVTKDGQEFDLASFPDQNVPITVLSDPNAAQLSSDLNGVTSNQFNGQNAAGATPFLTALTSTTVGGA